MLKMPFKTGIIFREKRVPFLFKIMTLEMTCDHLGQDFGDLFSKDNSEADIYGSLIYNGYLAACMVLFKRPRYSEAQALYWAEYMSGETRKALVAEVTKLMVYLRDGGPKTSVGGDGDELKKK